MKVFKTLPLICLALVACSPTTSKSTKKQAGSSSSEVSSSSDEELIQRSSSVNAGGQSLSCLADNILEVAKQQRLLHFNQDLSGGAHSWDFHAAEQAMVTQILCGDDSLDDRVLFAFLMDAENSIVDPGGVGRIPGATDQDTRRGLYIIILNEDKTKVAFDPNNEEFDYRAIYFYPAREFFNDGFGETVCFPTFLNLGAINGSTEANRMKNRVRTCGASMRPLLREE